MTALPIAPLAVALGVLGLAVGSFLNVVIWRVPRGESVVRPRSACPGCGTPIRPRDNVPVLSWLLLRGRARCCGAAISPRYLIVEVTTAVAFAAVTVWAGWSWALPAWLYLATISICLTAIDLDVRRLPDVIVKPSYAVLGALFTAAALADGDQRSMVGAAIGTAALGSLYLLIVFIAPRGMGWGDVKLSGVLGMALGFLGWQTLAVGAFAGFLLGGVVGGALLAIGRIARRSRIPYGPWMILGAWVGAVWGVPVASWYLGVAGV